jgi:hypothetical protein
VRVTPGWTPRQRTFFAVTFAGGLLWTLAFLLASEGWSLDDELTHFLRSRDVWTHPELIFDVWTRIGRNLFHVLPAAFGLTAARLWTLAFAAAAVLVTVDVTQRLGARRAWLVPALLWFQPWFVELSWGVLTQTPFLFALLLGIWLHLRGKVGWAGVSFGFLPLIRHEGIAVLAFWLAGVAVEAVARRRFGHLLRAAAAGSLPLVLSNAAAWFVLGDLPLRIYFAPKPTEIYGSGPLWHFAAVTVIPAGLCTILLAACGLPGLVRRGWTAWPLGLYAAYFALHSLIFWKGLFASGGYYHFLLPIAPGLAVAAVFGADALLPGPAWRRWLGRALVTGCIVQGLLLVHVFAAQRWMGVPLRFGLAKDPIHHALEEALDWQRATRPASPVVCAHVYVALLQAAPARPTRPAPPADLPANSLILWETKYADLDGWTPDALQQAGWRETRRFGGGTVRIFEKPSDPPAIRAGQQVGH